MAMVEKTRAHGNATKRSGVKLLTYAVYSLGAWTIDDISPLYHALRHGDDSRSGVPHILHFDMSRRQVFLDHPISSSLLDSMSGLVW